MEICFCGHPKILLGVKIHDDNGYCNELVPNDSGSNKNSVNSMIPCNCKGFELMIDSEKGINNIIKK